MKLANRIAAFIGLASMFSGSKTPPPADIIPADMKAYKPRPMKRANRNKRRKKSKAWLIRKARRKMQKRSRKINRQKSKRRASC